MVNNHAMNKILFLGGGWHLGGSNDILMSMLSEHNAVLLDAYEEDKQSARPWRWVGHRFAGRFIHGESGMPMIGQGRHQNHGSWHSIPESWAKPGPL